MTNTLQQLWHKLTDPIQPLPSRRQETEARAMSAVLLFIVFFTLLTGLQSLSRVHPAALPHIARLLLLHLSGILFIYLLSRSRYYRWGIPFFIVSFSTTILLMAFNGGNPITLPIYLIVPMLFASIFLDSRGISMVALWGLGVIAIIMWRVPAAREAIQANNTLFLYTAVALAILWIVHYYAQINNQQQSQLQEREARLRQFLDEANDWVFTLDTEGIVTYVNQKICDTTGCSAAELIGKSPLWLTANSDSLATAAAALQKLQQGEQVAWLEVEVSARNGRSIWLEIRGRVLIEDGQPAGTLHFGRDITGRKKAEMAEREQRLLAEALQAIAATLNSTLNLDEVLDNVLGMLKNVLPYDVADIAFIENGVSKIVRHQGYEQFQATAAINVIHLTIANTPNLKRMFDTHQPLVIADTYQEAGWRQFPGLEWIRSLAGMPIVLEGACIGFLHVNSREPGFYKPAHGQRLQAIAAHVANAVRNARLYEAERKRRQLAETLRQSTAVLNSTLALNELLNNILEQLSHALDFDSASVQQRSGDDMVLRAARGFTRPDKLIDLAIPIGVKSPNFHVIAAQKPLAYADVTVEFPHFQQDAGTYQSGHIRSWLGVPLVVNERIIGLVTIDRSEVRPFTAEEIEVATTFAHHAAIAMNNAQLYERLARYNETLATAVAQRTAELQHTTNRVEAIITNSPDAILLLHPNLQIEHSNPAFTNLFGYAQEERCPNFPSCLADVPDSAKFMRALNLAVQTGQQTRLEFTARRKDKTIFDADMAVVSLRQSDAIVNLMCSIRDITQLKEIERIKDDFVSNVSHELRTPITNLKLYHDLLQLNPKQQEKYITRLGREIERLNTIIENLLHLSRLDQGRIIWEIAQVDLNELVQQLTIDRAPLAEEKQITLTCLVADELPSVAADANHLSQAISILLTNALNYTPAGGEITLRTRRRTIEDESWVGISVEDMGPGIPDEERPHIFERFYRGQAGRASGAPGTGLGLAIADEIVKWHEGEIEIANAALPRQGAIFTVWLPLHRPLMEQMPDLRGDFMGSSPPR